MEPVEEVGLLAVVLGKVKGPAEVEPPQTGHVGKEVPLDLPQLVLGQVQLLHAPHGVEGPGGDFLVTAL